ncbi:MAG: type I glyceraldehyde-3-phosphate dehydrogenase [candidate division WOR-3 bacterium]
MLIGINGFGRVGRQVFKIAIERGHKVVGINDLFDASVLAHLLKYDSVYGKYEKRVEAGEGFIAVDGLRIPVTAHKDPKDIPWGDWKAEIVIEASGAFRSKDKASAHLRDTVKKVIITAPAKGEIDATFVMGCNENTYDPQKHHIVSNASCTTNAFAHMVRVIKERFGIKRGLMTTVHAYTNDQRILDSPHKDLRRARSAGISIIPTSTGAAKAITIIYPELKGKLDAVALRVPTQDASLVDFAVEVERPTTPEEVNEAFRAYADANPKYMGIAEDELVSIDIVGERRSVIFDPFLTQVVDGTLVKVFGWYDNEWGYSERVVDLAEHMLK